MCLWATARSIRYVIGHLCHMFYGAPKWSALPVEIQAFMYFFIPTNPSIPCVLAKIHISLYIPRYLCISLDPRQAPYSCNSHMIGSFDMMPSANPFALAVRSRQDDQGICCFAACPCSGFCSHVACPLGGQMGNLTNDINCDDSWCSVSARGAGFPSAAAY